MTCSSSFPEPPLEVVVAHAASLSKLPEIEMAVDEDSSSSSSDSSESKSDEEQPESRATDTVGWQLSTHKKGLLHLSIGTGTACARILCRPIQGVGLKAAKETGANWSPRCLAALTEAQRASYAAL